MPDEISAAAWISLEEMRHFRFSRMGRNIGRLVANLDKMKPGAQLDLSKMPIGDMFKNISFDQEQY